MSLRTFDALTGLCCLSAACTATALDLDVDLAAGLPAPSSLSASLFSASHALVRNVPLARASLPGRVVFLLPSVSQQIRVVVFGDGVEPVAASTRVEIRAHARAGASVVLDQWPADIDGDLVPDTIDNCPRVANPEQENADMDDSGDACQPGGALPGCESFIVHGFAGTGQAGFIDDGTMSARLNRPRGVWTAPDRSVYFTDASNHCIRRVTPDGRVTTVAGSGAPGFSDGPAATARFQNPYGIAGDGSGTLFVADLENHRIRRVDASGWVSTLAGTGVPGAADGPSALLERPLGIALDTAGNVYFTDASNRVRVLDGTGQVSTYAGSTTGAQDGFRLAAQFNGPAGIAFTSAGDLLVADAGNFRIRRVAPDGMVSTFSGSGIYGHADGSAVDARFSTPHWIAWRDDAIAVTDAGTDRVRLLSPSGAASTIAGDGRYGDVIAGGCSARFKTPFGVAWMGSSLVVADKESHRLKRVDPR